MRPAAASINSPLSGSDDEVLRIAAPGLIVERRATDGWKSRCAPWSGATLASLAEFADVDLDAPFSVGHDTPPVGDPGSDLAIEAASVDFLVEWFALGQSVLDRALGGEADRDPTVAQIWPEHFDLGCDVAGGSGRVNLGASPGDGYLDEPYLYIGPWGPERPGGDAIWNAPFGATIALSDLARTNDHVGAGVAFMLDRLALVPPPR